MVRGLIVMAAAASVAAGADAGVSVRAPGRIFFSSDRASNLYPQVFRIGLDGGMRRQLTDPTVPVDDPSVSPDGTKIVYSSGREVRVHDLVGGADTVIVPADAGSKRLPRWSPDGRRIAYFEVSSGEYTSRLEVVDAVGGTRSMLGQADLVSGLAWSPDADEIAYSRPAGASEVLAAARVDGAGTRTITRIPFAATGIAWSPGSSTVVYALRSVGLYAVPAAGGPTTTLSGTFALDPAFSPDGTRVAFSTYASAAGAHSEIASIRPDGSDERLLTHNSVDDRHPAWSPDGTQLLEARSDRAGHAVAIVVLAVDGSGEHLVRREARGTTLLDPFWAHGGSAIVYVAGLLYNDRDLYSMWPDGTGLRQLTHNDADDADPAVSPDGRRLAFDRAPFDPTHFNVPDLYLMQTDGTGLRRLTGTPKLSETQPAWSPDGKRLAFVRTNVTGISRILVLDLARHTLRPVTPPETLLGQPAWSTDGAWITFRAYHQGFTIDAVRPDGRSRHTIDGTFTDSNGNVHGAEAPAWSPHGRLLAFLAGLNAVREVWEWSLTLTDPNSAQKRTLATGLADSRPAWSPDATTLVYSTGSDLYTVNVNVGTQGKPRRIQHAPGTSDEPAWGRP